ncbi:AMP-binding protein [Nocardioides dubius]|uniref:Acyl-CoA synthetase n=1 Tax=Nocardioides dubius TaxID=317019 RepID=A0ABP4EHA2_9ACTN
MSSINSFPDDHAAADPQRTAYQIDGGRAVSYAELVDSSRRIARLLGERGLRRGDVVAILLPNMAGLFEVAWACQRSGLRYTAISNRLNAQDVAYILSDSGARELITCAELGELAGAALALLEAPPSAISVDGGLAGADALPELLETVGTEPLLEECEGTDLLYSSGTTGRPKGVAPQLTAAPLGQAPGIAPFLQETWEFGPDTVYLCPAPLYHSAPLRFSMAVQRFGGTVVVMERFDAARCLELIEAHQITHVQMVPTMFIRLLALEESVRSDARLSSLRAVIHAAAPCPPAVKQAMIAWLGPIVDEYYAGTENYLMTLIRSEEALRRPGSVGRPLIGSPRILGEDGELLGPGVSGEIWSEGGLEFSYLNAPEKTAASRNDRGWSTAGDLGYLDEDGYLYISDRRDDLIISGGVNIYPLEAENVLIGHEAVADVAVIGVPHPELGAEVRAVVHLAPGRQRGDDLEQQLIAYCQQALSRYKCPRSIDFVDSVPRTPTGKLMRREVRAAYGV